MRRQVCETADLAPKTYFALISVATKPAARMNFADGQPPCTASGRVVRIEKNHENFRHVRQHP